MNTFSWVYTGRAVIRSIRKPMKGNYFRLPKPKPAAISLSAWTNISGYTNIEHQVWMILKDRKPDKAASYVHVYEAYVR